MSAEFNPFKDVFGPIPELSAQEKALRRKATAFALVVFKEQDHRSMKELAGKIPRSAAAAQLINLEEQGFFLFPRITLTDQEINLTEVFITQHPEPQGFDIALHIIQEALASYRGVRIIFLSKLEGLLRNDVDATRHYLGDDEIERKIFKEDPSGIRILQKMLNRSEDEATQARLDSEQNMASLIEAQTMFAAADSFADSRAQSKPGECSVKPHEDNVFEVKPAGDTEEYHSYLDSLAGNLPFRLKKMLYGDAYIHHIFDKTGYVKDQEGNVVKGEIESAKGCRLFYEKYLLAVNFYLLAFGGQIIA